MSSIAKAYVVALAVPFLLLSACGTDGNDGGGAGGGPATSLLQLETVDLPSDAKPAHTPGSPGVSVTNPQLIAMFGSADFSLNNARHTRYHLSDQAESQPDAIVVLVPGFEGGASTFAVLAESLMRRAKAESSMVVEVWAVDRRSNQLEDTAGLDLAEQEQDPSLGLDFLFGEELGLELASELDRRAIFYNTSDDVAFMAQWTTLVHSQDINAVVEAARSAARNANVFLGGHSAGTGFTARYAATDFNLDGGAPEPGYEKLRGLVLLEGGGERLPSEVPSEELLDQIEARFDGGLYGAVSSQEPRCIKGEAACTVDTQADDCAAFENTSCTEPVDAYAVVAGLLSPQLLAVSEVAALEGDLNGDAGISILQADQNGIEGNNAVEQVPELSALTILLGTEPTTSVALIGLFLDDDGAAAALASFVATSLGTIGPTVEGVRTWLNYGDEMPSEVLEDHGPAPTELPTEPDDPGRWGVEVESTDLEGHMIPSFYEGGTNFSDWYYPSSGLALVSGLGLDTSALSAPPPEGRGRTDIENITQARNVNIPVIAFGGSNGLVTVPGRMLSYADSLAACSAPSCDGTTPRVLDREQPNTAFPTFGDAAGGFEVFISEGYSHVDIVAAEDDETNNVVAPLLRFIERNVE